MPEIICRRATCADIPQMMKLFADTVLNVNTKDYTPEETADWAACGDDVERWRSQVNHMFFIVAADADGRIKGFAAMRDDGYLHFMFVHKDCQGQGIATRLLSLVESHARGLGVRLITSEVSITARPFFESRGYAVKAEQKAHARHLYLTNYRMEKNL